MTVTLVAAVARDGVIGRAGDLVVRIPEDLRRFKALTMGHTLVMGRRTWDSIGRALPGRRTIVVTRQPSWTAPGADVAGSVEAALEMARGSEVFVVGGGEIYTQTIDQADVLELTEVDAAPAGDTYFPPLDQASWAEVRREPHDGFAFVRYERAAQAS
jgi:dihydrofolate reductase